MALNPTFQSFIEPNRSPSIECSANLSLRTSHQVLVRVGNIVILNYPTVTANQGSPFSLEYLKVVKSSSDLNSRRGNILIGYPSSFILVS
jgi:hypothetical protein